MALEAVLAIPVLMFAVGVVGNVTAIAVLSRTKRERKESAFYTLVCGLAVTDLLGTCLASPITIATVLQSPWPEALCEFHSFLLLFFGVAGLSIICTMSAERYLAISHPYTYKRWAVDQHVARWCLFAIYAGNVLFCCLPLLGFSRSIRQPPYTWCFIDWRSRIPLHVFYSFLYAGISSLLILVTIACNVALCWTLLVMRQRIGKLVPRASIKKHWRERSSGVEIQMMLLLIVTSLVVLVCSTPLVVRIFVNQRWLVNDWDADLQAIRFASVNPILDPWVYILLRRTVFHKVLSLSKRVMRGRAKSILPAGPRPTAQYLMEKNCATPLVLSTELLGRVYLDDTPSTTGAISHVEEKE
ncbi:prostaglandin E2 receptor EP4 subtype-like [Conger conger]|uniref:prostaglandin E2 receptor EP4 subtype-like n=1 Tax=Conger conger TaxID=82655 RepID=UPI002A5AC428|nr:prostaglandin E2 receptor EP4 subtype-like [Conger conger]